MTYARKFVLVVLLEAPPPPSNFMEVFADHGLNEPNPHEWRGLIVFVFTNKGEIIYIDRHEMFMNLSIRLLSTCSLNTFYHALKEKSLFVLNALNQ